MRLHKILAVAALMLLGFSLNAQNRTVQGKVIDAAAQSFSRGPRTAR